MKKIFTFLMVCFSIISCRNENPKTGSHMIDVGAFTINVPSDFKYVEMRGIDSFVGIITNGESSFSFDYGMYSPQPPLTKTQFIENNAKKLDFDATHLLLKIIDTKPYQYENGKIDVQEITKRVKNLKLEKRTESIKLSIYPHSKPMYYYALEFDNTKYNIPFFEYEKNLKNFEGYTITIDTIANYKRTISIWNDEKIEKYSSLSIIPLNKAIFDSYLWIGIKSSNKLPKESVERIFNSVQIQNN